jgi:hypothetical protein
MPLKISTFVLCFKLAFAEDMTPRRRRVVWTLLFLIPTLVAFDVICLALDEIFFPGYRRVQVKAPIFAIGHARSGTTLTHQLLTKDERLVWSMTYELFLPAIVQRKLVRFIADLDRRHFGAALEKRVEAWEDRTFAKGRNMHPMSLTGPEEDEFVMSKTGLSGTLLMLFPYFEQLGGLSRLDEQTPAQRARVMNYYRQTLQRQLYMDGPELTYLSKNPGFCNRVKTLIEYFPDARFIVNMRHPYKPIPSLMKMMVRNWKAAGQEREQMDRSLELLKQNSLDSYRHPVEVLDQHPEIRWAVLDYEKLIESPKDALLDVYEKLEIPPTPEFIKALDEEEQHGKEHRADHIYSLDEFGITHEEIQTDLAPLFERFGWER